MGATTFYLLELERKQKQQFKEQKRKIEEQAEVKCGETENAEIDYNKLTKEEIKAILKEKGIDFNDRAKKDDLIGLLKEFSG